jgi:RNA polymerase sigma-70 factor (ECF subfamily)
MPSREEEQLVSLNRRYRPALMAFFLRRRLNHAEAEDLTQEVFVRLSKAPTQPLQSADAYIFQTASNLLRDKSRREKVRTNYLSALKTTEGLGVDTLDPLTIAIDREAVATLAESLKALPEVTRNVFILYRIENVDKRTIGEAFRISPATIDRHLARAMAHLISCVRGERQ